MASQLVLLVQGFPMASRKSGHKWVSYIDYEVSINEHLLYYKLNKEQDGKCNQTFEMRESLQSMIS